MDTEPVEVLNDQIQYFFFSSAPLK